MTTFIHTHPVARTVHWCEMCGRRIDPGETYQRAAGLDGSAAWTWKQCVHCDALVPYLLNTYGEDEYGQDMLYEWEPDTVKHLRVKALAVRRKWRRRDGSLYPIPNVTWHEDANGFKWPVDIEAGGA